MTTKKELSNIAAIMGHVGGSRTSDRKAHTSRENGAMSFPYRITEGAVTKHYRTLYAAEQANVNNRVIQRRDPESGEWMDMRKGEEK